MDQLAILLEKKERLEARIKKKKRKSKQPTIIDQAERSVEKAVARLKFVRSQTPATAAEAIDRIEKQQVQLQEQITTLQNRKREWAEIQEHYDEIVAHAKDQVEKKEQYLERLKKEGQTEDKVSQINTLKSLLLAAGVTG